MVSELLDGAGQVRPSLNDLGLLHGTDKSTLDHGYCDLYEQVFGHLRDDPIQLLELGVHKGASIRMWADYFTHPHRWIFGIDRAPTDPYGERVVTLVGDQAAAPVGDWSLDIVIDDASHLSSKTIASFNVWWPVLKPGGYYVVEDIVTSYYLGEGEHSENPDRLIIPGERPTAMQFFKRMADETNRGDLKPQYRLGFDPVWVWFHPNMVIVRKSL